jgi:TRAP-type C4-dicarboxylate transport system permease small subunit
MAGQDPLEHDVASTSDDISELIHHVPPTAIPEAGALGRWINRGGYIFAAGIVIAAAILLAEVFLRYVLNRPTIWAHEVSIFLCGIAFLYGGVFCAARDSHIRVVLVYDHLGPRLRRVFDVIISAISALAAAFFAYAAYLMSQKALFAPGGFRLERSGSAWNPPTPAVVKVFMLVMLIVLTLQFIILTVNHWKRLRERN